MSFVETVEHDMPINCEDVRQEGPPPPVDCQSSDGELLQRFLGDRSDVAFAELVTRHGPLVMAVCRRILRNEQDAEDAFQATFLVLSRKAGSVRKSASLPAWLHKTAYRMALRARAGCSQRREQPLKTEPMIATESFAQIAADYDRTVFDEELNHLPDKYRLPLFLCCLEGKPRVEAAKLLGCSPGALKGRLERARQMLRSRLLRRGVTFSAVMALLLQSQQAALAGQAVAPSLVASTVHASMQYSAGQSLVGYVSQNALTLANGSFQVMSYATTRIVAGCLLAIGAFVLTGNWLPAPAVAEGSGEGRVNLQLDGFQAIRPDAIVVSVVDDERQREGKRESAEKAGEKRRGAQQEGGSRRPAEKGARQVRNPLSDFKPKTQREAALYEMIQQLRREIAQLRRDVGPSRNGQAGKAAQVFKRYDKNKDGFVTLDEWLAMTNGNVSAARRTLQTQRFREAGPGSDGKLSPTEFLAWYTNGHSRKAGAGDRGGKSAENGKRRSPEGERGKRKSAEEGRGTRKPAESGRKG